MKIRPATAADLTQTVRIYEELFDREELVGGSTNWQRGIYPTADTARAALEAGWLFIGEEGNRLWGSVILNTVQLPEYDAISWPVSAPPEAVLVLHTLCIRPDRAGRGLARQMVAFCEEEARRQGKAVLRLDTWEGNLSANRLYRSAGYTLAGSTEFFFQGYIEETLNCYEKAL